MGVELTLNPGDAKPLFAGLLARKQSIETIVWILLEWREMSDRKSCRVCIDKAVEPHYEADWPRQFALLQDMLERFDAAFAGGLFHTRMQRALRRSASYGKCSSLGHV